MTVQTCEMKILYFNRNIILSRCTWRSSMPNVSPSTVSPTFVTPYPSLIRMLLLAENKSSSHGLPAMVILFDCSLDVMVFEMYSISWTWLLTVGTVRPKRSTSPRAIGFMVLTAVTSDTHLSDIFAPEFRMMLASPSRSQIALSFACIWLAVCEY